MGSIGNIIALILRRVACCVKVIRDRTRTGGNMKTNKPKAKTAASANDRIRLSRSLGQNLLVDANIAERIVKSSGIDETCGVCEIGPGQGALTKALVKAAGHVTAIEIDGRFLPLLGEALRGAANVTIIHGDALKMDIGGMIEKEMPGMSYHVCANLPYYITTPILSALTDADIFRSITVMVQKEVAERICAKPGTPQYGAFSVYMKYYHETEILFEVPPDCFMPKPKVNSAVVKLSRRAEKPMKPEAEELFFTVTRASFIQRRKTLVNALASSFGGKLEKSALVDITEQCGFSHMVRGEALGLDEFCALTRVIYAKIYKTLQS